MDFQKVKLEQLIFTNLHQISYLAYPQIMLIQKGICLSLVILQKLQSFERVNLKQEG